MDRRDLLTLGLLGSALGLEPAIASVKASGGSEVTDGNNAFAIELYRKLAAKPGNLFFSPLSLSTALGIAYAGARGTTATEMAKVLHFPKDPKALAISIGSLAKQLTKAGSSSDQFQLSIANALWPAQGAPIDPGFTKLVRDAYSARLQELDYHSAEAARAVINNWVASETRGKIKDLIPPGTLGPATMLVLTNAIYFKGAWVSTFYLPRTKPADFHVSGDKTVKAPMMSQTESYRYSENDLCQTLAMPYRGRAEMVILLPRKVDGLLGLEKSVTAAQLATWIRKQKGEEVVLSLPRFKTSSAFDLGETLAALGMPSAFKQGANFQGMSPDPRLYLTRVVHKAYVRVDEQGTEAAAATGLAAAATAFRQPLKFNADHPFLYLIRDTTSGAILFLGRVVNPMA